MAAQRHATNLNLASTVCCRNWRFPVALEQVQAAQRRMRGDSPVTPEPPEPLELCGVRWLGDLRAARAELSFMDLGGFSSGPTEGYRVFRKLAQMQNQMKILTTSSSHVMLACEVPFSNRRHMTICSSVRSTDALSDG